jgi:hypothetical protein
MMNLERFDNKSIPYLDQTSFMESTFARDLLYQPIVRYPGHLQDDTIHGDGEAADIASIRSSV